MSTSDVTIAMATIMAADMDITIAIDMLMTIATAIAIAIFMATQKSCVQSP